MRLTTERGRLRQVLYGFALGVCLMNGGASHATVLVYEPFEYGDVADPLAGQYALGNEDTSVQLLAGQDPTMTPDTFYLGPWIQGGGDSQVVRALPSLAYPILVGGVGGVQQETLQFSCCTFGRSGRNIITLGDISGPRTVYESFLINFGTQGSDPPADFGRRGHELWDGGLGDSFLSVAVLVDHFAGYEDLQLWVKTALQDTIVPVQGGGLDLPTLAASNGGTHLIVIRYDFNQAVPDVVRLYLDPVTLTEPAVADAQIVVTNSDLFIDYQGAFTQFTFSGAGHVPGTIDEIRWATTYAEAVPVPEPGQGMALLSGAGMIVWLARRRPDPWEKEHPRR